MKQLKNSQTFGGNLRSNKGVWTSKLSEFIMPHRYYKDVALKLIIIRKLQKQIDDYRTNDETLNTT